MSEFGLTLIARLAHSDELESAVADFQRWSEAGWKADGLTWTPYRRGQRHVTVFSLVRSQPKPLSLHWLPADFPEMIRRLGDWGKTGTPAEFCFETVVRDRHIVSVHAPRPPSGVVELWTRWKTDMDSIVTERRAGWEVTNPKGDNLFQVKYPAYKVYGTIGHLTPAKSGTFRSSWSPVTVRVSSLSLVSYAGRTLDDIRGEAELSGSADAILRSIGLT